VITGRINYRDIGKRIGLDLEEFPDKVAEPLTALATAASYWDRAQLNTYADQDNIEIITKRINGGLNGLEDRKANLARCQRVWGSQGAADAGPTARESPTKKGG
jgi:putative chitinase